MKRAIGMALLLTGAAFGQQQAALPSFDAASVQVSKTTMPNPRASFRNSKVEVFNAPMKLLVMEAWRLKDDKMLVGAPAWFNTEQYDIVAKANPNTSDETLRQMLQSLLLERFQMQIHREDRPASVYLMTVKKGGHKLQPAAPESKSECPVKQLGDLVNHRLCTNITMDQLAQQLPGMAPAYIDLPVVNLTDLKGGFNFQIDWVARGRLLGKGEDGQATDPVAGLTMFESLDRLGFELKAGKHAMSALVIDHIEKNPIGN